MQSRILRLLPALLLAILLSAGHARAENMGGHELVAYMSKHPVMRFAAGSVASFGGKSANSGIGGFTMQHKGGPRLKGSYTIDLHGWVDMVYADGSRHRFTVEKLNNGGLYRYKLTYTKGPFRGRSFVYR